MRPDNVEVRTAEHTSGGHGDAALAVSTGARKPARGNLEEGGVAPTRRPGLDSRTKIVLVVLRSAVVMGSGGLRFVPAVLVLGTTLAVWERSWVRAVGPPAVAVALWVLGWVLPLVVAEPADRDHRHSVCIPDPLRRGDRAGDALDRHDIPDPARRRAAGVAGAACGVGDARGHAARLPGRRIRVRRGAGRDAATRPGWCPRPGTPPGPGHRTVHRPDDRREPARHRGPLRCYDPRAGSARTAGPRRWSRPGSEYPTSSSPSPWQSSRSRRGLDATGAGMIGIADVSWTYPHADVPSLAGLRPAR